MLARSSSPKEQGLLPGMADSSSFICPQCLLTFLCLAGIAQSLQSSIRGLLGIQAFSQPSGRQQWGDEPCRVNDSTCPRDRVKSRLEQVSWSAHPLGSMHTKQMEPSSTGSVGLCHTSGRNKDGARSGGSDPTQRAPGPLSTPHK